MYLKIGVVCLALCVFPSVSGFADEGVFYCPNAEEGRQLYQSGELAKQPNFAESPSGGARVQQQHPNTYLFGQAKYINWDGRGVAVCQYSNHVGLVATFVRLQKLAVGLKSNCKHKRCEGESHWRNEHTNSTLQEDKLGQENIFVCVETKNEIEYPSTLCGYSAAKKQP